MSSADTARLTRLLRLHWGLVVLTVDPLDGGMNSATWSVTTAGGRYVAKQVPASGVDDLAAGCAIAARLADRGLRTGRPVPLADGRLLLGRAGLALLEHVPGRELTGETEEEQRRIGLTLAAVHRAGDPGPRPADGAFLPEWLDPTAPHVRDHPWLARAVADLGVLADALPVTWSVLHADPAPAAFVHDPASGVTGVIDWSAATRGPTLYDVASAVMYLGGRARATAFLAAYAAASPLHPAELELLGVFGRLRWAVQGAYFARRLATDDLTGITDASDNQRGLDDARRGLSG